MEDKITMAEKYDVPALTKWANASAAQFWKYAARRFKEIGKKIGNMPLVEMNTRLTSTGGRAWGSERIDLSCYLMVRNFEKYHTDTIPHELCHIIAARLYPNHKQFHGKEWKWIIQFLGVKTSTYHSMITKSMNAKGIGHNE